MQKMKIIFAASEYLSNDMPLLTVTKHVSWKIMNSRIEQDFFKLSILPGDHNKYIREITIGNTSSFWLKFIPRITFLEKLVIREIIPDIDSFLDSISDRCRVYIKTKQQISRNKHKIAEIFLHEIDYEFINLEILTFEGEIDISKFSKLNELRSVSKLQISGKNSKIQKLFAPVIEGDFAVEDLILLSTQSITGSSLKKIAPYKLCTDEIISGVDNDKLILLQIARMTNINNYPNLTELNIANVKTFEDFVFPRNLRNIYCSGIYTENFLKTKDFSDFDVVSMHVGNECDISRLRDVKKIELFSGDFSPTSIVIPKLNCEKLHLFWWDEVFIGKYHFYTSYDPFVQVHLEMEEKYEIFILHFGYESCLVNNNVRIDLSYNVK